jgi:hypothetical protein
MTAMGQATEARFQIVEKSVADVRQDINAVKSGVDHFQSGVTAEVAALKQHIAQLQTNDAARQADAERVRVESLAALEESRRMLEEVTKTTTAPPPGLPGGPGRASYAPSFSSGSQAGSSTPHELRTDAILAGLGTTDTLDEMLARAEQILQQAQVPQQWEPPTPEPRKLYPIITQGVCPYCKTATMVTPETLPKRGPPQLSAGTGHFENEQKNK